MNGITNCPDDVKLASDPSRAYLANYARRRVPRRVVIENGIVLPKSPREPARRHGVGSSQAIPKVIIIQPVSDENAAQVEPTDTRDGGKEQVLWVG